MSHPLVTIGLPVYNGAAYLDEALQSLCAQSFPDLQILISDNASTDETPAIISKWAAADSRITSVRQPENIGGIANFAFVMDNATTPYFMFGAHDDRWSPDYVAHLYEAITARPDLICAVASVSQFKMDGPEIPENKKKPRFIPEVAIADKSMKELGVVLRQAKSGWYYGLYDIRAIRWAKTYEKDYGFIWGHDFVMLLSIILSDKITGDVRAVYYQRITTDSERRYKPVKTRDKCAHLYAFLKQGFLILNDAPMPIIKRLCLYPVVFDYCRRRLNWRLPDLITRPIMALFEKR